ncbi:DUF3298 and DUF4163 domain-containing protein [Lentibacillus saliphilus]|uniref:DUF3298 and DUF4163 domain-containing protein n=1 Tax=Lentibacillus saliphilus TaxID=2737028 RepID=UPI001C2F9903|nr:DUF3298 and DUF4163 domain-containing protein [Lentibacillus saliphilus]
MTTPPLPAVIKTRVFSQQGMTIYFPQVSGLTNKMIEDTVNQRIYQETINLIQEQYSRQNVQMFAEMIGTFEVKANERNVLSLVLTNYAIAPYYANGLTILMPLTFDLETGKHYELKELFKPGTDYISQLSELVQEQIIERQIPVIEPFTGIGPDQEFYIVDQALVIFFQPITISPRYVGAPTFPIPIYKLESLIPPNGLLERMAAN